MNDKNNPANTGKEGHPSREEELIAYLDGELDATGRERLKALLAEDQDLREALEQHKAIAAAIAAPDSEAGMSPGQTLAEVRGRLHRSRRVITAGILAAVQEEGSQTAKRHYGREETLRRQAQSNSARCGR